jgi:hypothetical protein
VFVLLTKGWETFAIIPNLVGKGQKSPPKKDELKDPTPIK